MKKAGLKNNSTEGALVIANNSVITTSAPGIADYDPETGECELELELEGLSTPASATWFQTIKKYATFKNLVRGAQLANGIAANAVVDMAAKATETTTVGIAAAAGAYLYTGVSDTVSIRTMQKRIQGMQDHFIMMLAELPHNSVQSYRSGNPALNFVACTTDFVTYDRTKKVPQPIKKSTRVLKMEQTAISKQMLAFFKTHGTIIISLDKNIEIEMTYNYFASKKELGGGLIAAGKSILGATFSVMFLQQAQEAKKSGVLVDPGVEAMARGSLIASSLPIAHWYENLLAAYEKQEETLKNTYDEIIDKFFVKPKKLHALSQDILDFSKYFGNPEAYAKWLIAINRHIDIYNAKHADEQLIKLEARQDTQIEHLYKQIAEKFEELNLHAEKERQAQQGEIDALKAVVAALELKMNDLENAAKPLMFSVSSDSTPVSPSGSTLGYDGEEEKSETPSNTRPKVD